MVFKQFSMLLKEREKFNTFSTIYLRMKDKLEHLNIPE
jgi:hypothetical protein